MPGDRSIHFQIMLIDQGGKTRYYPGTFSPWRTACPSHRTSTIRSSRIWKYCHVFQGESTQISRDMTAVFGIFRICRISSQNIIAISCGLLMCVRIRLTRTNTVQPAVKRIKSYCDLCRIGLSSTTPRRLAISCAPRIAMRGCGPLVIPAHFRCHHPVPCPGDPVRWFPLLRIGHSHPFAPS